MNCFNCKRENHLEKDCDLPVNFYKIKEVDNYLKIVDNNKSNDEEELLDATIQAFSIRDNLMSKEEFNREKPFFIRENLFRLKIQDEKRFDIIYKSSLKDEELLEKMTEDEKMTVEILKNMEIEKITNKYIRNNLLKLLNFIDEEEHIQLALSNTPYEFYSSLNLEKLQILGW